MTATGRATGDDSTSMIWAPGAGRGPTLAASAAPAPTSGPTRRNLIAAKPLVPSAYSSAEPAGRCGPTIGRADAKPLAAVAQAPAATTASQVPANTHLAGERLAIRKAGPAAP